MHSFPLAFVDARLQLGDAQQGVKGVVLEIAAYLAFQVVTGLLILLHRGRALLYVESMTADIQEVKGIEVDDVEDSIAISKPGTAA